jgi:molybdopterin-biosynthesis enzyme MoeA-like protein
MRKLSKPNPHQPNFSWDTPSDALTARKRMVELPLDLSRPLSDQVLFVSEELWVPLCIVNGNVHILPGVPRLFKALLTSYLPTLRKKLADANGQGDYRVTISTPLPESEVAGYLTRLAKEVEAKGVKVGSYPGDQIRDNVVTLVGKDRGFIDSIVTEVELQVKGRRLSAEELAKETEEDQKEK